MPVCHPANVGWSKPKKDRALRPDHVLLLCVENNFHTRSISMFGELIRQHRLSRDLSLREFCIALEFDASHWSKIERGILPPPKSEAILRKIADLLEFKEGSQEWFELHDYAALGAGRVPSDILTDAELAAYLPLVFRTVRNSKPTAEELVNLAETIRLNVNRHHLPDRE